MQIGILLPFLETLAPLEEKDTNAYFILKINYLALQYKAIFSTLNYLSSTLIFFSSLIAPPTVILLIFFFNGLTLFYLSIFSKFDNCELTG